MLLKDEVEVEVEVEIEGEIGWRVKADMETNPIIIDANASIDLMLVDDDIMELEYT